MINQTMLIKFLIL